MKELVAHLAASLAARPDEVLVTESESAGGLLLELKVAEDDVALVIGQHGRTARAMRALVSAAAAKRGRRCFLKILSGGNDSEPANSEANIQS